LGVEEIIKEKSTTLSSLNFFITSNAPLSIKRLCQFLGYLEGFIFRMKDKSDFQIIFAFEHTHPATQDSQAFLCRSE
jgi:hypothetical protein